VISQKVKVRLSRNLACRCWTPVPNVATNFSEVKVKVQGQNRRTDKLSPAIVRPWFKISYSLSVCHYNSNVSVSAAMSRHLLMSQCIMIISVLFFRWISAIIILLWLESTRGGQTSARSRSWVWKKAIFHVETILLVARYHRHAAPAQLSDYRGLAALGPQLPTSVIRK